VHEILIPRLLFLLKVLFCAQGLGLHHPSFCRDLFQFRLHRADLCLGFLLRSPSIRGPLFLQPRLSISCFGSRSWTWYRPSRVSSSSLASFSFADRRFDLLLQLSSPCRCLLVAFSSVQAQSSFAASWLRLSRQERASRQVLDSFLASPRE
jgi:hypothetical protein